MSWILTWNSKFISNDKHFEAIHQQDSLKKRVQDLHGNQFVKNLKAYKVSEEVDIDLILTLNDEPEVKPIRPTVFEFENDEEYEEFIKYATSTEKTDSTELNHLRELMKNHKRSERLKK